MEGYYFTIKFIRLNEFVESTPFDVLCVHGDHEMSAACAKP